MAASADDVTRRISFGVSATEITLTDTAASQEASVGLDRYIPLLVSGTALSLPEIDSSVHAELVANLNRLAHQVSDHVSDGDKLALIGAILQEIKSYRNSSEHILRERLTEWRNLASRLLSELFHSLGVEMTSSGAAPLVEKVAALSNAEEIVQFQRLLDEFLRPGKSDERGRAAGLLSNLADRSTSNHNATGLRGGGAALEHLSRIMKSGGGGFVVVFRLQFLEMIEERFGAEGLNHCLMEAAAHLTAGLRDDDAVYYWSKCSLVAIAGERVTEQIMAADLRRLVARPTDILLRHAERSIIVRIPIEFDYVRISQLDEPADLNKFASGMR